jgi:hypothetical protein
MKVVGHQAEAENRQRVTSFCLPQKAYENKIVKTRSKNDLLVIAPVNDVIVGTIDEFSGSSGHSFSDLVYVDINE